MDVRNSTLVPATMAVVLLSCCPAVFAGTIGLAWDPSEGAQGYRVHYGPSPGQYSTTIDVGNVTEVVVSGPPDCIDSFYAVTAYNGGGESGFSNELDDWPRASVSRVTPPAAIQGALLTLDVEGANIRPGSTLETDNPNVLLEDVTVLGCERIQAAVTIEPTAEGFAPAEIGRFALRVAGPDPEATAVAGTFEVLVNPARFDVVSDDGPSQGRLDGRDTMLINRLFGSRSNDPVFDPDADFNGDGWVDGSDLAFLAGNLGKCWSGAQWTVDVCPTNLR